MIYRIIFKTLPTSINNSIFSLAAAAIGDDQCVITYFKSRPRTQEQTGVSMRKMISKNY